MTPRPQPETDMCTPSPSPAPLRALRLALAVAAALALNPAPAFAQSPLDAGATIAIDLPAASLSESLRRLAQQASLQLFYTPELVAGRSAPAVSGRYTPRQALELLLAGSGLTASANGSSVVLTPAPAASGPPASAGTTLPELRVRAARETRGDLPAPYAGGQVARGSRLGLLGETDYMETPFSTTSLTAEGIQHDQVRTVGALLNNDPSFAREWPGSSFADRFSIRGFDASQSINGLFGLDGGLRTTAELYERVEIFKGPSALLNNGIGGLGGNVALLTKRATDQDLTQVTLSYASSAQFGLHLDVGRRFGDEGEWGVRGNVLFREGDLNVDHQSDRQKAASLGIDYRGRRLRASLDLVTDRNRIQASRSQVYWDAPVALPLPSPPGSRSNPQQPWEFEGSGGNLVIGRVEFDVSESLRLHAAAGQVRAHEYQLRGIPFDYDAAGNFEDDPFLYRAKPRGRSAEAGATLDFSTGPLQHALSLSVASLKQSGQSHETYGFVTYGSNLYAPRIQPMPELPALPPAARSGETTLGSIALADLISWPAIGAQAVVGIRRQSVKSASFDSDARSPTFNQETTRYEKSAWTPAVGVLWRATPAWSLYANAIQGLESGPRAPSEAAYVNAGEVFPPTRTNQQELGVKMDRDGLGMSLALFRIAKLSGRDVPTGDGRLRYVVDGKQVNRGAELSLFGEPKTGLRLLGGVAYLDPRYEKTEGGTLDGTLVPGYARWTAILGGEVDLPAVPGLTLSGRIAYKSSQLFYDNVHSIPSWTRFDIGARYALRVGGRPVVLRAGVVNLSDRNYWESASNGLLLAAPRTVQLSTTVDF